MVGVSTKSDVGNDAVRWTLRLIGPLRIARPDGEALKLSGRRERALLAYLALTANHRDSRRNLTTLLWGEDSDNLTLDNLRTCLWSLRKSLGDSEHRLLIADRDWIGLDPGLIELDVTRVREALAAADHRTLDGLLSDQYGELLQDLDLDSDPFQRWLRDTKSRFAGEISDGLRHLMAIRQADGDDVEALALSQLALRFDPYDETALRTVLQIHAENGRRHVALQTYQVFAARLAEDLDVQPEAETALLVDRIAASENEIAAAPSDVAAPLPVDGSREDGPPCPDPGTVPAAPARRRLSPLRLSLYVVAVLTVAGLGALLTIGAVFWRVPELAPAPFGVWIIEVKRGVQSGPPSIAVLPFHSYGETGANEFADAISEGLSSALSITSEMLVVSRSSVLVFKGSALPPHQIAERLGVRYLVEGSVTRFGSSVTVRTALIDTAEGGRVHSIGEFERLIEDFFTLQRDITLEVVTTLQVRLTEGEQERISVAHGTRDYQAWLLEAQGQKKLRLLAPESNMMARRTFERALALDPKFPGAMTGLAWTYLVEAHFGGSRDQESLIRTAGELAQQALTLDDKRASTYALIGAVAMFAGRFDVAVYTGERAVELEYNDSDAAALLALTLTYAGEPRRAIPLIRRAMRLKPYPPRWYFWLLARAHRLAGNYDEALRVLNGADAASEPSPLPMVELILALVDAGSLEQARAVGRDLKRQHPDFLVSSWGRVPAYRDAKRTRLDREALAAAGVRD